MDGCCFCEVCSRAVLVGYDGNGRYDPRASGLPHYNTNTIARSFLHPNLCPFEALGKDVFTFVLLALCCHWLKIAYFSRKRPFPQFKRIFGHYRRLNKCTLLASLRAIPNQPPQHHAPTNQNNGAASNTYRMQVQPRKEANHADNTLQHRMSPQI